MTEEEQKAQPWPFLPAVWPRGPMMAPVNDEVSSFIADRSFREFTRRTTTWLDRIARTQWEVLEGANMVREHGLGLRKA